MKLMMLNYEFPPLGGGAGQAHLALCQAFSRQADLSVDVVTSGTTPGVTTETIGPGVTVYRVGIGKRELHRWRRSEVLMWLYKSRHTYRQLLDENTYDLVHAFFAFPSGWLCYRSRHRCPYIVSLRGSDVPGQNARLQWEYKLLGPWVFKPIWCHARRIVACSAGLKERALRFMPEAAIDVIPNGVDLETFRPAPAERPEGPLRLITVGRLSETKRVHLLIDTVDALKKQGCPVMLTVVGGGGLYDRLNTQIADLGLAQDVTLKGRCEREALPDLYRAHDLCVSASMQEGMSNAMLEAMASGLPIVTTRCEGVAELIEGNGVVVEQESPVGLAAVVRHLSQNAVDRRAMGQCARARAETFSWERAAEQYLRCYRDIQETLS